MGEVHSHAIKQMKADIKENVYIMILLIKHAQTGRIMITLLGRVARRPKANSILILGSSFMNVFSL